MNTFLSTYQEPMLLHGVLTEAFSYLKGPQDLYTLYKSKYDEEIKNFIQVCPKEMLDKLSNPISNKPFIKEVS